MESIDSFVKEMNRIASRRNIQLPNSQRNIMHILEPSDQNLSYILEDALYLLKIFQTKIT